MSVVANLVPRISTGFINTVNDAVDGDAAAPAYIGTSPFSGQAGKIFSFDDDNVVFDSSVGQVYGGLFQYVQLASDAGAIVPGQLLFWDTPVDGRSIYIVTTAETPAGTDAATLIAGVCLNKTWTPGNYAFLQIVGLVPVQYRSVLTSVGAIGGIAYTAGAGGADLGYADVINSATPTEFSDVSLLQRRFLGVQNEQATNAGLKNVYLSFQRLRG